jgi:hypothetical protein
VPGLDEAWIRPSTGWESTLEKRFGVTPGADGRFEISGLEPDSYSLLVTAPGYVPEEFRVVIETNGTQTLNVALTPTAAVSGRIEGQDRRPLTGIGVEILAPAYDFDGRRWLQRVDVAYTDDHGAYRIYWISPGTYYLAAVNGRESSSGNSGALTFSLNQTPDEPLRMAYYPNAWDVSEAATIELKPGEEKTGLNFVLSRLQTHGVRGRVIDAATGKPPVAARVYVGGMNYPTKADGTFEAREVPAGSQVIHAVIEEGGRYTAQGWTPVLIGDSDIDDVIVTLIAPPKIQGRLTIEGRTASLEGAVVWLSRLDGPSGGDHQRALADGTFTFENAYPGEYRVSFGSSKDQGWEWPRNAYLKEVLFNSEDALNQPLRITSSNPSFLTLVVGTNAAQLDGVALDAKGQSSPNALVALIPNHRDRVDLYREFNTDAAGRFHIEGIPPGEYKVFAWRSLEPRSYFDPAVLLRYEHLGQPVHLGELSRGNVQVRVAP